VKKLYLGIKGHAVCIDQASGNIVWKTKLKSSSAITNIYTESDKVFAYAGGHLFALDASSGTILWENPLSGFGYGTCIFAGENTAAISAASAAQGAAVGGTVAATTAAGAAGAS